MAPTQRAVVGELLDRHGTTYADELRIDVAKATPAPLFQLLCAALLMSARISASIAVAAARALREQGWTTAQPMADATWAQRTKALNRAGYARYDESTSRMLGATSELLLDRYGGDLRRLRDEADCSPRRERSLLKECKGLGDVGVDIFFREVQVAWDELSPFADKRALKTASALKLPDDPKRLARLVDRRDWPRFVAALVRAGLARDVDDVRAAAARR